MPMMVSGQEISGFTRAEATFQVTSNPSCPSHHLLPPEIGSPSHLEMLQIHSNSPFLDLPTNISININVD